MGKKDIGSRFSFYLTEFVPDKPGSKQGRTMRVPLQGKAVSRPFPGTLDIEVKGRKKPVRVKKSFLRRI